MIDRYVALEDINEISNSPIDIRPTQTCIDAVRGIILNVENDNISLEPMDVGDGDIIVEVRDSDYEYVGAFDVYPERLVYLFNYLSDKETLQGGMHPGEWSNMIPVLNSL